MLDPFSKRYGYSPPPKVTVREAAPPEVRSAVVFLCSELGGSLGAWQVQKTLCDVQKRIVPVREGAVVWADVQEMLMACEWTQVYEVVQRLDQLIRADPWLQESAELFEQQVNEVFEENGIGWKLEDGEIKIRGGEEFEFTTQRAREELAAVNRTVAGNEMVEAIRSLSRLPEQTLRALSVTQSRLSKRSAEMSLAILMQMCPPESTN
jgi:hypothetical protein